MVFMNVILYAAKKTKRIPKRLRGSLIDSLRIHCVGGSGGNGLPKYGGMGGQGGCVYCIGKENINLNQISKTLPDKRLEAKHGEESFKRKIIGSPGEDAAIDVPLGITIYSENVKLGEINAIGDTCILARGGPGGTKENGYIGREGQKRTIVLDLKLIADVGFVGFPNAGKSTLLKALSRAKPQIADYPFTTIRPNLGTIIYPDFRQISLADLPGLIEGAHINIGMGHKFLKHVERTKLLLLIADVQGFRLSPKHNLRTCFETVLLLNKELELYNEDLIDKPSMLLINKMDTENSKEKFDEVNHKLRHIKDYLHEVPPEIRPKKQLQFSEIMGISAKTDKEDINLVKKTLRELLDLAEEEKDHQDVIDQIEEKIREKGPMIT